jgi:hypothetical protein
MNFPRWVYQVDGKNVAGTIVYNQKQYDAVKDVFNSDTHGGIRNTFIHIEQLMGNLKEVPDGMQERIEEGREEEVKEKSFNIDECDDKDKLEAFMKEKHNVDLDKRKSLANMKKDAKAAIDGNG